MILSSALVQLYSKLVQSLTKKICMLHFHIYIVFLQCFIMFESVCSLIEEVLNLQHFSPKAISEAKKYQPFNNNFPKRIIPRVLFFLNEPFNCLKRLSLFVWIIHFSIVFLISTRVQNFHLVAEGTGGGQRPMYVFPTLINEEMSKVIFLHFKVYSEKGSEDRMF